MHDVIQAVFHVEMSSWYMIACSYVQEPKQAKERMEAAMQRVIEKRHAQDDALYNSHS